jgi:small-conductance mechanosensitive channel
MRASFLLSLIFWLILSLTPTFAQTLDAGATEESASASTKLPDPLTPDAARALVSKLSDEDVRALLLERLDLVAKEQEAKAESGDQVGVFKFLSQSIVGIGNNFFIAVRRLPELFGGLQKGVNSFLDGRGLGGTLQFVGLILVAVLAGQAAEWLVNRAADRWRAQTRQERHGTLTETLRALSLRLFFDVVGLIAFALAARIVIGLMMSAPMDRFVAWSFVFRLIIMVRFVSVILRFVLAPSRPDLRLVTADDWTARYLHRNLVVVAALIGSIGFLIPALDRNGVPMGELRLGWWLNLAAYAWVIHVIWNARAGISKILVGEDDDATSGTRELAAWWPVIAIALVFLNWVLIEIIADTGRFDLLQGQQNVALALILLAPVFDTAIRGLVRHLTAPLQGEGPIAEQAYHQTKQSYVRIGRVVLIVAEILVIARLWGIKPLQLAEAGFGAQFAGRGVGALLILAAGYLAWELVNIWANRKLVNEQAEGAPSMEAGEGGGAGSSRLATILPIVRVVSQGAILTIAVLLALGHMGLNITALLAGAGIAGLAIGFGAQTLVRDVVSGVFFLLDDAFRVGEYIDIGGTMGTVDKISVRSLRLRHHLGPLHIIPYGEILKLTNMSRDWAIVKLKFTVPFDTDVMKVKRLFRQIGQDLMEIPEIADTMLEPFKFQGVYGYDDVGIIVRGKFMAKAGMQFAAKKEILARVRSGFEENGIEFARKEVRVQVPGLDGATELDAKQKEAIAAGASQAAEQMIDEAPGGSGPR